MDTKRDLITSYKLLHDYIETINQCQPDIGWDDVVITARDEAQKSAYIAQLEEHYQRLIAKFHVFADPVVVRDGHRVKIGSGGSTIAVLKWLIERYGKNVFAERKILLIHCGGYSQRTPQYTALGKIFASLPIDIQPSSNYYNWTMLDVKLALLRPFCQKMNSGVWVSAPDDIVIYTADVDEFANIPNFDEESFVALGHPSPISIARNHGVYVLESSNKLARSVSINSCLRVLQKPSTNELKENNAIVDDTYVITDSSYYIGKLPLQALAGFDISTLTSEVDCYGHFQCPLGSSPTVNNRFTSQISSLLVGTPLKVLYLTNSTFYHLGTIPEYFEHLTQYSSKHLATSLKFKQIPLGCATLIHSTIHEKSNLDENTIIENSKFELPIVTNNNVIYGCFINFEELTDNQKVSSLNFPEAHLVFTVAVQRSLIDHGDTNCGWITVMLPLKSDLKSELWTEKRFSYCQTPSCALMVALGVENPTSDEKWSLSDIMKQCDPRKMIQLHRLLSR